VDLNAFDLVIGNTANYYKTKGLTFLIEAVANLAKTVNVACLIVGEGPERPILEEMIRRNGLEKRVFLVGQLPEASRYLKAYDVFAFSSVKEGFPWAILEAMSAGLPIVATKVGAMPEVIEDGIGGWLVDPGNAGQLYDRLQWFASHREQVSGFGQKAKQRGQEEFTLEKLLGNYRALFKSIVGEKVNELALD
jgi:glycosyltransferase involved in cell wall biosynthesis